MLQPILYLPASLAPTIAAFMSPDLPPVMTATPEVVKRSSLFSCRFIVSIHSVPVRYRRRFNYAHAWVQDAEKLPPQESSNCGFDVRLSCNSPKERLSRCSRANECQLLLILDLTSSRCLALRSFRRAALIGVKIRLGHIENDEICNSHRQLSPIKALLALRLEISRLDESFWR